MFNCLQTYENGKIQSFSGRVSTFINHSVLHERLNIVARPQKKLRKSHYETHKVMPFFIHNIKKRRRESRSEYGNQKYFPSVDTHVL